MAFALRTVASLALVCAGVAASGCSSSVTQPPSSAPAAVNAPTAYDVSRINQLRDDLPAGFIPGPPSAPIKIGDRLVASVGTVVSSGGPFTVDPPICRPLLKPVDGQLGADTMHIRGDETNKRAISVGAVSPVTMAGEIPSAGCDRMTYGVEQKHFQIRGTVERLVAPTIGGATTMAVKFDAVGFPDVEYSYGAIVDDRLYVDVQARLAPNFAAEPVLSDLLIKAVSAVRSN